MSIESICNGKISNLPSLEVVRKVQKNIPYVSNLNWLLHTHYVRQDFDYCKMIIEKQFKEYINPEYLYYIRGLIAKHDGNLYVALQDFQRAAKINSNNIEFIKEIGKTLYLMGRNKQSLKVFKEAENMISYPDHEIFYYIGDILCKNIENNEKLSSSLNDDINEAKKYLHNAILHGRKFESYQKLASIYEAEKDYGKSIEILENCLQISPENTKILANIGVLYLKLNETEKAFNRLTEITNNDEKCSNGLIAYGAILQSKNDIDGALSNYFKIPFEDQKSPELWSNIGLCFLKKKKIILSIACLKKSYWLSPLNYNCLYNLSLILLTAEQYASAFHTLAAAINLRKDSPEVYMLLGSIIHTYICLRKLDDMENAYLAMEKATSLIQHQSNNNKNPLILLNFSLICYETDRIDTSVINYNKFVKLFHNVPLPIEYKFGATKLKSLLQYLVPEKLEDEQSKLLLDKESKNEDKITENNV